MLSSKRKKQQLWALRNKGIRLKRTWAGCSLSAWETDSNLTARTCVGMERVGFTYRIAAANNQLRGRNQLHRNTPTPQSAPPSVCHGHDKIVPLPMQFRKWQGRSTGHPAVKVSLSCCQDGVAGDWNPRHHFSARKRNANPILPAASKGDDQGALFGRKALLRQNSACSTALNDGCSGWYTGSNRARSRAIVGGWLCFCEQVDMLLGIVPACFRPASHVMHTSAIVHAYVRWFMRWPTPTLPHVNCHDCGILGCRKGLTSQSLGPREESKPPKGCLWFPVVARRHFFSLPFPSALSHSSNR